KPDMLRLAFDFIITWRETRTRPNAYGKNEELWNEYGAGRITKDELNEQRFAYPLLQVGVADKALVKAYSDNFFDDIVYKKKLMPHAREALEYLASAYNLYILSNGFRELQEQKMRSAGVEGYFKKIVLSEDIGVHKPFPEIFYFAMSATQSELHTSLMIGDNWKNDVEGAKNVGMGNVYYNIKGEKSLPFKPGFDMRDWREIASFL
ncbi:HAD-IA family hydrolase, partial [Phocaeicola vulgatus]|uniref:HAD family hydrolase n=1 Tax=Phocaeicola vulgatus TaxID=821 RepID=UPI0039B3E5B1